MSDPQVIIDNLFSKLEQAKIKGNNGEIQQATHALRVQITNKKNAKIPLNTREKAMLGPAVATRSAPEEHGSPVRVLITVVVLMAIAGAVYYFAWPYVKGMMH